MATLEEQIEACATSVVDERHDDFAAREEALRAAAATLRSLAPAQESPACICDERKARVKKGGGLMWHCPEHGLMEFEK